MKQIKACEFYELVNHALTDMKNPFYWKETIIQKRISEDVQDFYDADRSSFYSHGGTIFSLCKETKMVYVSQYNVKRMHLFVV